MAKQNGSWYLVRLNNQANKYRLGRFKGETYYFDTLKQFEVLISVVAKGEHVMVRHDKGMPKTAEDIARKHWLNNKKSIKSKNRKK